MVDISKLANPPAPAGRSVLDVWFDTLTKPEQQGVTKALTDTRWGHVALLKTLVEEGAPDVSEKTFRTWRLKRETKA